MLFVYISSVDIVHQYFFGSVLTNQEGFSCKENEYNFIKHWYCSTILIWPVLRSKYIQINKKYSCKPAMHLFHFRFSVRQASSSPVTRDVQPQTIHDWLKKPCTKYFILNSIIISVTVAPLLSLCTILTHHNAYYQLTTIKLNVVKGNA